MVLCNFRDWWKIVWFCGRFQGFFIGFLGSDRVFGALRSGVLLLLGHWRTIRTGFQGSWLSLVCSWWLFGLPGLPGVRHGSWRVSVGFMVVWFALYLKDGFLGFLSLMCSWWLPTIFKSLPWTLRCSSWTDREQGFRVLDWSDGLLEGVPWTPKCSSHILKSRLGCSQGFFLWLFDFYLTEGRVSRFLTWQQMFWNVFYNNSKPSSDFWVFITNSQGSCWWIFRGFCCCLISI